MEANKIMRLSFADCVESEGYIYFYPTNQDAFMKMDSNTFELFYIESFWKNDKYILKHDSVNIFYYNGMIYSINNKGDYILAYNIKKDIYQVIDIAMSNYQWGNFECCYIYHNYLYLISNSSSMSKRLNMDTNELEVLYIAHDNYNQGSCGFAYESKCYLLAHGSSEIAIFDSEICECIKVDIGSCAKYPKQIEKEENELYILEGDGHVFSINLLDNSITDLIKSFAQTDNSIGRMMITQNKIWLLPSRGDDIYIFDKKNRNIIKYDDYPEGFQYNISDKWAKYYGYIPFKNGYLWAMRSSEFCLYFDKILDKIDWIKIENNDIQKYYEYLLYKNNDVILEKNMSLKEFMSLLLRKEID